MAPGREWGQVWDEHGERGHTPDTFRLRESGHGRRGGCYSAYHPKSARGRIFAFSSEFWQSVCEVLSLSTPSSCGFVSSLKRTSPFQKVRSLLWFFSSLFTMKFTIHIEFFLPWDVMSRYCPDYPVVQAAFISLSPHHYCIKPALPSALSSAYRNLFLDFLL